jgi:hypothetical protein
MINSPRTHLKLAGAATACVIAGVAAGSIADASAAGKSTQAQPTKSSQTKSSASRPELRLGVLARRTVEGSLVVSTKQGFVTVTVARGTVESVTGNQLTLTEGTPKATYKTVTLTLPADTLVRDNRARSTLAQVTDGQRATVIEAPDRALVIARSPASTS